MEFAQEMVIKAQLKGLKITEIPTVLSPDGRSRPPHLRPYRDGWRTLRFMLLHSPRWLFLYPGCLLIVVGLAGCVWLLPGPRTFIGIEFDVHTLLYAFVAMLLGFQLAAFSVFAKVFAISEGLLPEDPRLRRAFDHIRLETGLAVGGLLITVGIVGSVIALFHWSRQGFGPLNPSHMLRIVIPSVSLADPGSADRLQQLLPQHSMFAPALNRSMASALAVRAPIRLLAVSRHPGYAFAKMPPYGPNRRKPLLSAPALRGSYK